MRLWPDKDDLLLNQYLQELRLVRTKWTCHRSVLLRFGRFVGARGDLTETTFRAWLRSWEGRWSLQTSIDRVLFVNRFLNWLLSRQVIIMNPITELRRRYRCRSTTAITKALLSPNPIKSLQFLKPLPQYGSHLGPAMHAHVDRMRTLGLRYQHECRFLRFDRFLQQRTGAEREPLTTLVDEYVALASSAADKLLRIGVGRVLARALSRSGVPTAIPKWDRLLVRDAYRKRRQPYIYTQEQVAQLFQAAKTFTCKSVPLRPHMLETMLVLAYCAGLRVGEIARLTLRDVDLADESIEVRNTKFFKSRRLPLSTSAAAALRDYLRARQHAGAPDHPDTGLWWHEKGSYSQVTVETLLRRVIRRAGLSPCDGTRGPRIHDIRHTFVVHRMTRWYQEGVNPQQRLPYLTTYLGHRNINSTLVYLTITQELLQLASERFKAAESDVLKTIRGEQ